MKLCRIIGWDGAAIPLVDRDGLMFDAFKDYEVDSIMATWTQPGEQSDYEITVKVAPVKIAS